MLPRESDKPNPIWEPSPERIAASNLTRFIDYVSRKTGKKISSYDKLYQWSIGHPADFWESLFDYFQVVHSRRHQTVLTGTDIISARWFEGARLNFAENLLRFRDNHTAIVSQSEYSRPHYLTYRDLYRQVAACAASFKQLGIEPGERVAGFVPNIPQAIVAMLAATSIGAVWSSCSPDFGFQGVLDRFGQIEPALLIAADGYQYNGKVYSSLPTVRRIGETIESLRYTVTIPHVSQGEERSNDRWLTWNELLSNPATEIDFAQLPFDHPVYIMYSSGTTGVPKCIVHGAGGTLIQHLKELALHTDLKRDDTITYYTTCGWMMWNWLVSSLALGATIYLYDGSPSYPDLGVLFRAIEREKISVFGTSPKFLSACEKAPVRPRENHNLSSLRTILSTGSPLSEGNFEYVYRYIKPDLQLASISGGTDIISCFLLGNPLAPVYPGELQCRGLGMNVETFDDAGRIVFNQTGELVCIAPFPSRPVMFWDDPDNASYRAAYFEHFPGVWRHGDYIRITERGSAVVYGRSDATLNPGGVRIGTAEIYEPVEALDEIHDSLAIGQKIGDDTRIVLFVVTAEGVILDEALKAKIKTTLRTQRTPRHVPQVIVAVNDIPRTINGKKVEMAVTRVVHGQPVTNVDALANPEALEQFENLPELRMV